MSDEYVTREEFDKKIAELNSNLEQAINMANIAAHVAIFSLNGNSDIKTTLSLLEASLKNTENNLLYSPVSDNALDKYRKLYQDLLEKLRLSLQKH